MSEKIRSKDLRFRHQCQNCSSWGTAHGTLWGSPVAILKVSYCDHCGHSYIGIDGMGDNAAPAVIDLVGRLLTMVPDVQHPTLQ